MGDYEYSDNLDFSDFDLSTFAEETSEFSDIKIPIINQPALQLGPPPRGDFSGPHNFDVTLSGETTNSKKYVYSHQLNRVFLCMTAEMAVQFRWDWEPLAQHSLWVRATTILARSEQQEGRVLRCFNHKVSNDVTNRDIPEHVIPHVLRSARQGPDVVYCGMEDDERSWLSVGLMAPSRPPPGVSAIQHVYKFVCKHSCISGINRRPIEVLFTLEDSEGKVLGRRSLGVRVCSCPRRDMEKEEAELQSKSGGPPPRKRPKFHAPSSLSDDFPDTTVSHSGTMQTIQAVHAVSVLGLRDLPPDNPARPLLAKLTAELQRQMDTPI